PAVFEELFFRGYLFSALRAHTRPVTTVVASAVLFGVFHVLFGFDRILPSTLLGLVLGWVCWQTGSVLPGMVLHACHNGFLVESIQLKWLASDISHVPVEWLLAATVGVSAGAALLYFAGSAPEPREGEEAEPVEVFPEPD